MRIDDDIMTRWSRPRSPPPDRTGKRCRTIWPAPSVPRALRITPPHASYVPRRIPSSTSDGISLATVHPGKSSTRSAPLSRTANDSRPAPALPHPCHPLLAVDPVTAAPLPGAVARLLPALARPLHQIPWSSPLLMMPQFLPVSDPHPSSRRAWNGCGSRGRPGAGRRVRRRAPTGSGSRTRWESGSVYGPNACVRPISAQHRAGGRRVTGTAVAPAEETPGGRLDTSAAGVVPLVTPPRRHSRSGSIPAPASSATSGRS